MLPPPLYHVPTPSFPPSSCSILAQDEETVKSPDASVNTGEVQISYDTPFLIAFSIYLCCFSLQSKVEESQATCRGTESTQTKSKQNPLQDTVLIDLHVQLFFLFIWQALAQEIDSSQKERRYWPSSIFYHFSSFCRRGFQCWNCYHYKSSVAKE